MKRFFLASSFALLAMTGPPAMAQDMQDDLVAQLSAQGFTRIQIARTFLGRVRIVATSSDHSREIIFNPRTGEILRDYWDELDDDAGGFQGRLAEPTRARSSGFGRDDDDDRRGSGSGSSDGRDDDSRGSSGGRSDDRDDRDDDRDDDDEPRRNQNRGGDDDDKPGRKQNRDGDDD